MPHYILTLAALTSATTGTAFAHTSSATGTAHAAEHFPIVVIAAVALGILCALIRRLRR